MKLPEVGILIGACLGAYLIGSIPVGYFIAQVAGVTDIREHGSGNIGATNVARTLGSSYFMPVFLLDALKAYSTVTLTAYLFSNPFFFYSVAASYLIGNGYSVFLQGTGGKGVAATFGILAAYDPCVLALTAASWGLFYAKIRVVGIASVSAAILAPIAAIMCGSSWHGILFVTGISCWIIMRHYENIKSYFLQTL